MKPKELGTELGNVVQLDHINLGVTDNRMALAFFVEGLGFTRDPYLMTGNRNMWINLGLHQIHLPHGQATPFPGEIGLVVPDLPRIEERFQKLAHHFSGSLFQCEKEAAALKLRTPWGVAMRLHQQGDWPAKQAQALAYVDFTVPVGTAARIGAFYEQLLGCPVRLNTEKALAEVTVGPHQSLFFRDHPQARDKPHRNHIALYLTRYEQCYKGMLKKGLVMEPDANHQFRIAGITDPDTGEHLLTLEHELRSLYHGDYGRPLINRQPTAYRVD